MCIINGLVQGLIQAQWFTEVAYKVQQIIFSSFVSLTSLVIRVQYKNYKHINVKQFQRGV